MDNNLYMKLGKNKTLARVSDAVKGDGTMVRGSDCGPIRKPNVCGPCLKIRGEVG